MTYLGKTINFSHISYNCPELKLYGYRDERSICMAIKRLYLKTIASGRKW